MEKISNRLPEFTEEVILANIRMKNIDFSECLSLTGKYTTVYCMIYSYKIHFLPDDKDKITLKELFEKYSFEEIAHYIYETINEYKMEVKSANYLADNLLIKYLKTSIDDKCKEELEDIIFRYSLDKVKNIIDKIIKSGDNYAN